MRTPAKPSEKLAREIAARYLTDDDFAHAEEVANGFNGFALRSAGWLHDVLENNRTLTRADLELMGVHPIIAGIVEAVTRRPNETYFQYIDRIVRHEGLVVRMLKRRDLEVNIKRGLAAGRTSLVKRHTRALHVINGGR